MFVNGVWRNDSDDERGAANTPPAIYAQLQNEVDYFDPARWASQTELLNGGRYVRRDDPASDYAGNWPGVLYSPDPASPYGDYLWPETTFIAQQRSQVAQNLASSTSGGWGKLSGVLSSAGPAIVGAGIFAVAAAGAAAGGAAAAGATEGAGMSFIDWAAIDAGEAVLPWSAEQFAITPAALGDAPFIDWAAIDAGEAVLPWSPEQLRITPAELGDVSSGSAWKLPDVSNTPIKSFLNGLGSGVQQGLMRALAPTPRTATGLTTGPIVIGGTTRGGYGPAGGIGPYGSPYGNATYAAAPADNGQLSRILMYALLAVGAVMLAKG